MANGGVMSSTSSRHKKTTTSTTDAEAEEAYNRAKAEKKRAKAALDRLMGTASNQNTTATSSEVSKNAVASKQ